ncbi:protein FAM83F [Esox lucius]|uniref:Scaffolding anchor of CK1 domain-containing protein n=1 Tax=Esox lucius TaxID=8010 RepID=A0A3P8YX18_ESOLU|nr:protein FAM83F [Esox lucius]
MAESQLRCMDDGNINEKVPESNPEFYYSEEQRAAVEQLLKNGDGAFKMRLKEDNLTDFLSAREIKEIRRTFKQYDTNDEERWGESNTKTNDTKADSGVHSTYWPQMSDTEVPPLDIGWPNGGFFRGVTRVAVHTHPPKEKAPHIKEVVRRLIQEANKVIAIVMDLLTDVQILQDLLDAASRRSVAVYILLDAGGGPHFLDMCCRLQIGAHHLRNIRTRTIQGTGFGLSFGRLPGSLCSKYMLVDGEKVAFGTYSFSWSSSRMDRNMITIMTGQVVDFFDRDFRELYAVSEKLDLYEEFHLSPPPDTANAVLLKPEPSKPHTPVATSRFQVSLGDSRKGRLQVPAHKYHNPKYSLAFGNSGPRQTESLQDLTDREATSDTVAPETHDPARTLNRTSTERLDKLSPLPLRSGKGSSKNQSPDKKSLSFKKLFRGKPAANQNALAQGDGVATGPVPSPAPLASNVTEENLEVTVVQPKNKRSKMGRKSVSLQVVNTQDNNSVRGSRSSTKNKCVQS